MLRVVVFTGGRGSTVLSRRLLQRPDVHVVFAINGYDDGMSTGEVRRFLGDALGPSDFRKNASRVAEATASCSPELVRLLDARLPDGIDPAAAEAELIALLAARQTLVAPATTLPPMEQTSLCHRLTPFLDEWRREPRSFDFGDCAIGNLVFAGCFLRQQRDFNRAVDDYGALMGLRPGIIENVTDGTNAYLVGIDVHGQVLGTEAEIVDGHHRTQIADLFLTKRPLTPEQSAQLSARGADEARRSLAACRVAIGFNERLGRELDAADVIVYAPGTQHSSLYPSYLTPGLADRIAGNPRAIKLLVTNLEADAEIAGASAVSLVDGALYYLTEKRSHPVPAPLLITHYLLNDPREVEAGRPYVPLGQVETLEDPRLVRIGYYEDGITGRHDAAKVLGPFLESLLEPRARPRVGVLLYGVTSENKGVQTLLEILRGEPDAVDLTVYTAGIGAAKADWVTRLPFTVELADSEAAAERALRAAAAAGHVDFVGLFESSGMYRGEDLAGLFRYLGATRLAAVWGSRRLSVRDIEESFRYHYYRSPLLRAVSRAGSHALSATYLLLYGRYVADTLSGVRLVRAVDVRTLPVPLTHKLVNQHLLSSVLRRRADVLEVPVQFISLSPERVQRTGVADGVRSIATVIWRRIAPPPGGRADSPAA